MQRHHAVTANIYFARKYRPTCSKYKYIYSSKEKKRKRRKGKEKEKELDFLFGIEINCMQ